MNSETEIIASLLKNFEKSSLHKNEFFHSDSEIINIGNHDYLISIDSYSDEDHFRLNDPFTLGMNLASCTLSDIFACGGKPLFFCNSLNAENEWSTDYINSISKGVSGILKRCGAAFIGGDFGFCGNWNYTGVVIGQSQRIVTRKGALPDDIIYLTGEIGPGNFEAASVLTGTGSKENDIFDRTPVIFPLRLDAASLISKYATSCIDTSDGLLRSLSIISQINNCGFNISHIPYFQSGLEWAKKMQMPKECLAFGECGEYELLFTVKAADENELLRDARRSGDSLFRIGNITEDSSQIISDNGHKYLVNDFNIFARNFKDHYKYINQLTEYLISKGLTR
jgi:thiamine-monophosphate kinase